eukprot:1081141-Rhodomonas_salina.5
MAMLVEVVCCAMSVLIVQLHCTLVVLRTEIFAMEQHVSGTDATTAQHVSGTVRDRLRRRLLPVHSRCSYALPTPCPALTQLTRRACYAMS